MNPRRIVLPETLLAADAACLRAAERLLDTFLEWPSPVGLELFREALARARRTAEEEAADDLARRHLESCWDVLDAVIRTRLEWPRRPVEDLLRVLGGGGVLERLVEAVRGTDPELAWAYLAERHRRRGGRVPPSAPGVRERIEDEGRRITALFREWLANRGWDLPGLDARVTVDPGDRARSSYRPARRLVVLGGADFMVFEGPDGSPRVSAVIVLSSLAHELAGHAVQAALSRELPRPLRPDRDARLRFAALPLAEGFAGRATALALECAREIAPELGFDSADLEFLEMMTSLAPFHHATSALLGLAALRARQEPGFDAAGWLEEACGHGGFGELLAEVERVPIYRLLYDVSSFLGLAAVEETEAELARRGITGPEAWRLLGCGAWALPCYRDAVLSGIGG